MFLLTEDTRKQLQDVPKAEPAVRLLQQFMHNCATEDDPLFDRFKLLAGSLVFYRVCFCGLYNGIMLESRPYLGLMTVLLHLIYLGLENQNFFENCIQQRQEMGDRTYTLLELILVAKSIFSETQSEHLKKLDWILEKLRQSSVATDIISRSLPAPKHSTEEEKAQKKQQALARKAAVLAQIAQDQQKYMQSLDYDFEEDEIMENEQAQSDELANERQVKYPGGACILCQENVSDSSRLYGMLTFLAETGFRRLVDYTDSNNLSRILREPLAWDQEQGELPRVSAPNGTRKRQRGCGMTTCGHIMHIDCFKEYQKTIETRHMMQQTRKHAEVLEENEYLCPLCKSLGNSLLPILWTDRAERVNFGSTESSGGDNFGGLDEYISKEMATMATSSFKADAPATLESLNALPSIPVQAGSEMTKVRLVSSLSKAKSSLEDVHFLQNISQIYNLYLYPNINRIHDDLNIQRFPLISPNTSNLWHVFATTLATMEITSRGLSKNWAVDDSPIGIFDTLNPNALTALCVLAETCSIAMITENEGDRSLQRLIGHFISGVIPTSQKSLLPPMLLSDSLSHLMVVTNVVLPFFKVGPDHIFYWFKIFYVFEIVKCIVSVFEAAQKIKERWWTNLESVPEYQEGDEYLADIARQIGQILSIAVPENLPIGILRRVCDSACLAFARRCVLLLYSKYGQVPPSGSTGFGMDSNRATECSELERLLPYLRLGNMGDMLQEMQHSEVQRLWTHWCGHLVNEKFLDSEQLLVGVEQGLVYQLISLPEKLNDLIVLSLSEKCKNCGEVPQQPALCMFCGDWLCCQTICCSKHEESEIDSDPIGECSWHMRNCEGRVGMYLLLKNCAMLLLSDGIGCYSVTPYLDIHGEVDSRLG